MKIGIQGGKGSFNHQAILNFLDENKISNYEIKFLHITKKVLSSLESGEIDYGQFAIHNTLGGLVEETLECLGKYKFRVKEHYKILISHFLMAKKGIKIFEIKTIMAHPQVFKQCRNNISSQLPNIDLRVGEKELIDHSKAAELLSLGKLEYTIGIMGPKALAEIYDLDILKENMQDNDNNFTTFLLVER